MNYDRIYSEIIINRKSNPYIGYTEKHHILPRSLGGNNKAENIVRLSAREHFICHWLLVKIYTHDKINYPKMVKAFSMMCFTHNKEKQQRYKVNSRLFQKYKIELSNILSNAQSGDKNSQFGKKWISNIELKQSIRISKNLDLPAGWVDGRNKWKPPYKRTNVPKIKKVVVKKYKYGYRVSVDGIIYDSISHAADIIGIGHETARMRFKSKSFPEYKILSR